MKTIAVLHKPRFWVAVALTLPLAPALAIGLQLLALPSLDEFSKVDKFAQTQWESPFGPDITPQLLALDKLMLKKLNSHDYEKLVVLMGIQGDTLSVSYADATTESRCIETEFGDLITSYATVSRSGGARRAGRNRDLLTSCPRTMVYAGCLISACAAESGDWNKAIVRAEEAAHIFDGYRALGEGGQMEAAKARSLVYSLYRNMLNLRPKATIARQLIKSLQGLQDSDPVYKELPALGMSEWTEKASNDVRQELGPVFGAVTLAIMGRLHGDYMLRSAVEGISTDLMARVSLDKRIQVPLPSPNQPSGGFAGYLFPWTTTFARTSFLRQALKTDSSVALLPFMARKLYLRQNPNLEHAGLTELRHWKPEFDAGFDPVTVLMYTYFQYQFDDFQRVARTRFIRTQNQLLQTAFAARAYHDEHDRWPAKVGDLVPEYLESAASKTNTGGLFELQNASEPLRVVCIDRTTVTAALINQKYQLQEIRSGSGVPYDDPNRRFPNINLTRKADDGSQHVEFSLDSGSAGSSSFLRMARWAFAFQTQASDLGASVTVMTTISTPTRGQTDTNSTVMKPLSIEESLKLAHNELAPDGLFCAGTSISKDGGPSQRMYAGTAELNLPEYIFSVRAEGGNTNYVIEGRGASDLMYSSIGGEPLPLFRHTVEFPEGW